MTIQFAPGPERKKLAAAVAETTGTSYRYAGAPTLAYIAGAYAITREGALTGPDDRGLVAALREQGFEPAEEAYDAEPAGPENGSETPASPDRRVVEVPLDGIDHGSLDRLHRLIAGKEPLLKMALGVDSLPVQVLENSVAFPWLPCGENEAAYTQLAEALCRTAREKTRVNAKPQDSYPNPKFSLRTYLLSLGLVGDAYKTLRKILLDAVPGNSAWPSGSDPRKAAKAATAADEEPAGPGEEGGADGE